MNQPPDTENGLPGNDPNSTLTNVSVDSHTILNSTAEQTDLLTFVENFPLHSLNLRRPSPRHPIRSRQLISRIDQIRQDNRTRERAAKTRLVTARTNSRKEGHTQLLEAMKRCQLSKPGKLNTAANIGADPFQIYEGHCGTSRSFPNLRRTLWDCQTSSVLTHRRGPIPGRHEKRHRQ